MRFKVPKNTEKYEWTRHAERVKRLQRAITCILADKLLLYLYESGINCEKFEEV